MGWHPTFKYSLWAQLFPDSWWTFMNFGYDDIDLRAAPALVGSERYWKWAVQLYDKLGGLSELRGKDVLEVGSGRAAAPTTWPDDTRPVRTSLWTRRDRT